MISFNSLSPMRVFQVLFFFLSTFISFHLSSTCTEDYFFFHCKCQHLWPCWATPEETKIDPRCQIYSIPFPVLSPSPINQSKVK